MNYKPEKVAIAKFCDKIKRTKGGMAADYLADYMYKFRHSYTVNAMQIDLSLV